MTFGGRHPWVEDDLWWRTTFSGRQPSVDLCIMPKQNNTIFLGFDSIEINLVCPNISETKALILAHIMLLNRCYCSAWSRFQVQNQSFEPKQNTKLTLDPPTTTTTHPPTYRKLFDLVSRFYIDQRAINPKSPQSFAPPASKH